MKKFLLFFVLIFTLAILFGSCNDDGNVTNSTQSTSASSEIESTSSSASETESTSSSASETESTSSSASETESTSSSASETESTSSSASETESTSSSASETESTSSSASETESTSSETNKPAEEILVEKITLSAEKTTVNIGETLKINAEVTPVNADNSSVIWSITSGAEFATVATDGTVTGIAAGIVVVRATATDGSDIYGEITVTVKAPTIPVSSVTITGAKDMMVGDTLQLSAAILPENATDKGITWTVVSGSANASVSSLGVVTAKKEGTVKIRATANDGSKKYAEVTITVKTKTLWDGSGTANDPFLIRNLTDLKNLAKVIDKSGYYFRQVADIDCAEVGNWIVIGDIDTPFRHHIDGGGYTISNLCFDGEATALFQFVEDSHFKNMNIVNAHSGDNHVTRPNNTGKYPGVGGETGAIVGYGVGCSFENCTATVNFQSSNEYTGGLIGFVVLKENQKTLMVDCHASGTITSGGYTGGLIARIWHYLDNGDYMPTNEVFVKDCSADVNIHIFTISTERACVGGLIGGSFGVKIEKCHAKGSINVIDGDVGGLVGSAGNYTDIIRCYAEVDILATTDSIYGGISAGGLIGHIYSRSDVYDCYATGNISAPNVQWSPCQDSTPKNGGPRRQYYNPCGSLIGTLEVFRAYSDDQKITVYNCYATGIVDVPNICEDERVYCHGALIGLVLDDVTVLRVIDKNKKDQSSWDDFSENYIGHFANNYNLEDLRTYYTPINDYQGSNLYGLQKPKYTALPTHEYVEIITEENLRNQNTFEGWDFQNVWEMSENGPVLR